ncbi:MAG: transglutaminase-like domain-containing protein [Omnitrophica WOR_2 bacterium]
MDIQFLKSANRYSRRWRQVARSLIYIIVMVIALGSAWFFTPATVHYHITENYEFSSAIQDATVYLAIIIPKTGPYQIVENTRVIWGGNQENISYPFLDVVKMHGSIKAEETLTATIDYDVILRQGPARWTAPVMSYQLQPQTELESDEPAIIQQALKIASGQTRADAYALYAFTSAYLSWPKGTRIGGSQSAIHAYTTRVGGCGEFANLAVALHRAVHIPSQSITGLVLPAYPPYWSGSRIWNHPGGAHAWIEVHTESGWELADPSWGSAWPGPLKWLWFGRNDGSHLSYGESGYYTQLFNELTDWGKQNGMLLGAMSNPLHFVSATSVDGVTITPGVTLQKGWDGRWVVTASLYLLLIVSMGLLERHLKKFERNQGNHS